MVQERLISSADVAERAAVGQETARRWIRTGKLPATKVGHTWLVTEDDFRIFMAAKDRLATYGN